MPGSPLQTATANLRQQVVADKEQNMERHLPANESGSSAILADEERTVSPLPEHNADFYKITKSDSQSSLEPANEKGGTSQSSNAAPPPSTPNASRRCANSRASEMMAPKNSQAVELNKWTSADTEETNITREAIVRTRTAICKKRMSNLASLTCQNGGRGGIGAIGWQATRISIRERLAYMLMNDTLADIFFIFRDPNGSTHKIPAHKFVLSIGSAVFEAMFRFSDSSSDGGCANCIRELELVDVERESFEALLAFLYTDDVSIINKDSVMSILYTAKKYAVPTLEGACVNFLETCLNSENAFMLLAKARFYDEQHLANQCLEIIDEEAQEALKSEDFISIDHETLCLMLSRNTLRIKELVMFNAVVRWAMEACRVRNLSPTPENQRKVLGNALYQIRFPLMSPADFAKHVAPTKLLTDAEMVSIFLFYHAGGSLDPQLQMPFSVSYRGLYTPEMVVNRFQRVESSWGYTGTPDRVKFMVDTPILILGFGLYGSNRDQCQYTATIEILNFNTGKILATNECVFLSDGTPNTFRVTFEEPVEIAPNTTYVASAKLTGHESHYGTKGLRKIKLERVGRSDINWHFQYAAGNNNGTSVEDGQIPEIIFCTKHPY